MKSSGKCHWLKALLFYLGIIFTFSIPLYIQLNLKDSTAAWIALLCGIFVSLMAKYDEIIEISFGPIKARMQEKIIEANATIVQLQKVSLTQSKATLTDMMAGTFIGGITFSSKIELHDNIISTLKELGLNKYEILEAEEMWQKGMRIKYFNLICNTLEGRDKSNMLSKETTPEMKETFRKLRDMMVFRTWSVPTPEMIEAFIEENKMMKPEVKEVIGQYREYLQTGIIRKKEIFDRE